MSVQPISDVHAAMSMIDAFDGPPEEFLLPIDDALQDPIGMHMAIILDRALKRDWMPNGFEQKEGYRLYRYKKME
jgi:hypothetical protein